MENQISTLTRTIRPTWWVMGLLALIAITLGACLPTPPVVSQDSYIRGSIVTSVTSVSQPGDDEDPVEVRIEIHLPDITVYLKETGSDEVLSIVRTDLSGRFSIPHQPAGTYDLCWEADGFEPGCLPSPVILAGEHVRLDPIPIRVEKRGLATVFGRVRLGDNSLPRTFEPLANVNAFAQVRLHDIDDNDIDTVFVNNFGDYLIPQVPVNEDVWLQATIEEGSARRGIVTGVLFPGTTWRVDIRMPNHRPRFEPLVPSVDGVRVRTAEPGAVVQLHAEATDVDGDVLSYRWIPLNGSGDLSSLSGSDVDWQLPATESLNTVEVVAYDGKGGYTKSRVSVSTTPEGVLFSGQIRDTNGANVADAQIDINGQTTSTNPNGFFRFRVEETDQYVFNVRKQGYGLLSRLYLDSVTAGQWTLTPATVVSVDPTQDIDVINEREPNDCPGPLSSRIDWRQYPDRRLPRYQDGQGNVIKVGQTGVRFEDLPLGERYKVGDTFVDSGTTITVRPFVFSDGTEFDDGRALVRNGGDAGGSGNEMQLGSANLDFNFGYPLQGGLSMLFGEFGGNLNIEINGDFRNFEDFAEIDGETIGGVAVSVAGGFGNDQGRLQLSGTVNSFVIGGQELWIDDVLEDTVVTIPPRRECGPGLRVFIPANSLVDSDGNPPPGDVDVTVGTYDILAPDGLPGDFTAEDTGGQVQVMESFGAGSVSVSDGSTTYNLRPGARATLTLPVDPIHFAFPRPIPPTIPNLIYDATPGIWVEVGEWTLVGNEYVTEVDHLSEFNSDLLKEDQACVRIYSADLPAQYRLEVTIPQGPDAAPKVISGNVDNSVEWHVVYNLPTDTDIVLVAIRQTEDIPYGTFVVNTGGPQNPTDPNRPAYPYGACDSDVTLYDPGLSDPPSAGQSPLDTFLNGLYSFHATNLDEYTPASPDDPSPTELQDAFDAATNDYYAQIDPHGLRETLTEFQDTNGFTGSADEIHAVYANSGDLGFGRDMHCRRDEVSPGVFDVACYVSNYGTGYNSVGGYGTPDEADFEDAANQDGLVATVAMEYSRIEDPSDPTTPFTDTRVVKFYVYNAAGQRVNNADLDGYGARPIPQLCMVCHGGQAQFDGSPSPTNPPVFDSFEDVNLESVFLPFDFNAFTIVDGLTVDGVLGLFDKAEQQDEIRQLNQEIALPSDPGSAIEEVIDHMYPPVGALGTGDQDEDFVIPGWSTPAAHVEMYREVVAPACRACHVAQINAAGPTFETAAEAEGTAGSIRLRVCLQRTMPHARATYDRFWTSIGPHQPAQLISWGTVFASALDWSDCATAAPLPPPVPPDSVYHDPDIQSIWDNYGCSSGGCHGASAGLTLSAGTAYGDIVNEPSTQSPLDRIEPGDPDQSYLWHKVNGTQAGPPANGSGAQMPFGGPFLDVVDLDTLQQWIEDNAPESAP